MGDTGATWLGMVIILVGIILLASCVASQSDGDSSRDPGCTAAGEGAGKLSEALSATLDGGPVTFGDFDSAIQSFRQAASSTDSQELESATLSIAAIIDAAVEGARRGDGSEIPGVQYSLRADVAVIAEVCGG